jgi:uncharacterized protein
MVIEGIITTENQDGSMHVAPIGPHVNLALTEWTLKPFQSSATFANLRRTSRGVFHVVDDSLLMAAAVLGLCNSREDLKKSANELIPESWLMDLIQATRDAQGGWCLGLGCRLIAVKIERWDVSEPRAIAECSVEWEREQRAFWGWNRARHSILELAVLASRVHMIERDAIAAELKYHETIIRKTASERELAAFHLIQQHLTAHHKT